MNYSLTTLIFDAAGLKLEEEHRLRVFENTVVRRMSGCKRRVEKTA
jgi:hypothetical protein